MPVECAEAQTLSKMARTAQIRLPLGQGALGRAVLTRQPVAVNGTTQVFHGQTVYTAEGESVLLDTSLTDRLQKFSDRYGAVLAAPMSVQGEMYGGLVLYYPTPRNIQPEEIELASAFASQAFACHRKCSATRASRLGGGAIPRLESSR